MNTLNFFANIFDNLDWFGLDKGFWLSMGVVTLLVVLMNVVFWGIKPQRSEVGENKSDSEKQK